MLIVNNYLGKLQSGHFHFYFLNKYCQTWQICRQDNGIRVRCTFDPPLKGCAIQTARCMFVLIGSLVALVVSRNWCSTKYKKYIDTQCNAQRQKWNALVHTKANVITVNIASNHCQLVCNSRSEQTNLTTDSKPDLRFIEIELVSSFWKDDRARYRRQQQPLPWLHFAVNRLVILTQALALFFA